MLYTATCQGDGMVSQAADNASSGETCNVSSEAGDVVYMQLRSNMDGTCTTQDACEQYEQLVG